MTTPQQISALTQGMVSVMVVNVFASAIGMLAATSTVMPIAAGVKATDAGITDMKQAFGMQIVTNAIKNVGSDDIILLAQEVERLVVADMRKEYGDENTVTAIEGAFPGDLRAARAMAKALSNRKPRRGWQLRLIMDLAQPSQTASRTPLYGMKSSRRTRRGLYRLLQEFDDVPTT